MIKNDIKTLVDRKGITTYQFCKDTGLSINTAYSLYNNRGYIPRKEVMEKIAKAYGWQPGQYIYYQQA